MRCASAGPRTTRPCRTTRCVRCWTAPRAPPPSPLHRAPPRRCAIGRSTTSSPRMCPTARTRSSWAAYRPSSRTTSCARLCRRSASSRASRCAATSSRGKPRATRSSATRTRASPPSPCRPSTTWRCELPCAVLQRCLTALPRTQIMGKTVACKVAKSGMGGARSHADIAGAHARMQMNARMCVRARTRYARALWPWGGHVLIPRRRGRRRSIVPGLDVDGTARHYRLGLQHTAAGRAAAAAAHRHAARPIGCRRRGGGGRTRRPAGDASGAAADARAGHAEHGHRAGAGGRRRVQRHPAGCVARAPAVLLACARTQPPVAQTCGKSAPTTAPC